MAQNEMKAKPALPERVRSMEGLGVRLERDDTVLILAVGKPAVPAHDGDAVHELCFLGFLAH